MLLLLAACAPGCSDEVAVDPCASVTCTQLDRCHVAGTCDPTTGVCSNPPAEDGLGCDDGDPCTVDDACHAAACVGTERSCEATGPCRRAGVCDRATGACSDPSAPDGEPCNDEDACTTDDRCAAGTCAPGQSVSCGPPEPCRAAGTCDPATGRCSSPALPDGTGCSDGDACTLADVCSGGACMAGAPLECPPSAQCRGPGRCDPASGTCSSDPLPDGTACDDGDACTLVDTCAQGTCLGGQAVTCLPSHVCVIAGVCDPATGRCSEPPAPDGRACDDGDVCTIEDACVVGACSGRATGPADRPSPATDEYWVDAGSTITIPAPGVLANDSDLAARPLAAVKLTDPALGTLTSFGPDGSFTYEAPPTYSRPGLEPEVLWRAVSDITGFAQVADVNRDTIPDIIYSRFGAYRARDGYTGQVLWDFDTTLTTEADVRGCSGFLNGSSVAVGEVDGTGEVLAFVPFTCGAADRFVAINTSQITGGRTHARWLSEPLTVPHPGVYASPADPAPISPPARPGNFDATAFVEPTLARLTPAGSVKLLAHLGISRYAAAYYSGGYNGGGYANVGYAACRAVTGLPSDEGRPCRATFILDATDGSVEEVLTSPNPTEQPDVFAWRPWRQSAPVAADLDGDGSIEIVASSDVWRRGPTGWTLAWQTFHVPSSVAVADLDGDGTQEVIQFQAISGGARLPADSGIFIYRHDGTLVRRIPLSGNASFDGLITVGDADGDGAPELLFTVDGVLYVYRPDGRLLWMFVIPDRPEPLNNLIPGPVSPPYRSGSTAPQVYDLDLDRRPEVILNATARLFILNGRTGDELWSMDTEGGSGARSLALADFDVDGHVDIMAFGHTRWNCSIFSGGPVPCLGNGLVVSGARRDWAPGPSVFNQINYQPDAVTDTGRILFSSSPRADFRVPEQLGAPIDPRSLLGTSFTYAATTCTATSAPTTAYLLITPDNSPPEITSLPPSALLSITPYTRPTYQLTAVDPDPGDLVTFELVSSSHPFGAVGINLDASTGLLDFYVGPCGSYGGPCAFATPVLVTVAAVDALGARDEQSFAVDITYQTAAVPDVYGLPLAEGVEALWLAGLRYRVVAETPSTLPAGTIAAQSPIAAAAGIPGGATVDLTLSSGPGGSSGGADAGVSDAGAGDGGAAPAPVDLAELLVEPADPLLLVGEAVPLTATGVLLDGTAADLTASVAWSTSDGAVASTSASGVAMAAGAGTAVITAAIGAFSSTTSITVRARVNGDTTEPTAEITTPLAGDDLTAPIDVTGSATDVNFLRYELRLSVSGEASYTVIGGGSSPVAMDVLGTLDPTLLVNDQYLLALVVWDRGGNQSVAEVPVSVSGAMKLGHVALEYSDLSVPMSGLPLEVVRRYDSRDVRPGDFGAGWRLDVRSLRIRTNRVLGTGWARVQQGPVVSLEETSEHKVSLTLPGGRLEVFDLEVSPTSNLGSLDFTNVTGFVPRPGTLGRLEVLGPTDLFIAPAGLEDELVDAAFNTWNPQRFRYTAVDGMVVVVHALDGVESLTEPDGNTLTFGPGGIIHSAGRSVLFQRDVEGRITHLTDPAGHQQEYTYDARGDLVAHQDGEGNTTRFSYDLRHRLLRVVDPLGRVIARNEYDESGRLIAVIDAGGHRVVIGHDLDNARQVVTDALGHSTVYEYDDRGNVLSETNALGETTSYVYDEADNLTSITDPLGRATSFTHDASGHVLSRTNPLGETTSFTLDALGRILAVTDPLGRVTTATRDAAGKITALTDPLGNTSIYTYDASGNPQTLADPLGNLVTISYDAFGNRAQLTNAAGEVTHLGYDANGNITTQVGAGTTWSIGHSALGLPVTIASGQHARSVEYDAAARVVGMTTASGELATVTYDASGFPDGIGIAGRTVLGQTRDAAGRPTSIVDAEGNVTQHLYDAAGRPTTVIWPDGSFEVRSYDAAGELLQVSDSLGRSRSMTYDGAGRVLTETDALGGVVHNEWDAAGNLVAVIDPLGRRTEHTYDAANRRVATVHPDGVTETRAYDAAGRLSSVTDGAGHSTSYFYDGAGRLTQVTDALGNTTTLELGPLGLPAAVLDAHGNRTELTYDTEGRLTETRYPEGGTETLTYDARGRLIATTNGNGETIQLHYGASGQPERLTFPDGSEELRSYTPDGFVSTVTDARGTTRLEYEASTRRLLRITEPDGRYVRHAFDSRGNRTLVAHATGPGAPEDVTYYGYDALDRLATVTTSGGQVTRYSYDASGNPTTLVRPNGTVTETTFDARNRPASITHLSPAGVVQLSEVYTRDAAGNITLVTRGDGSRSELTYDPTGKLLSERHLDGLGAVTSSAAYGYDAVGNMTTKTGSLGTGVFVYDRDNRLLSALGTSYTYDGAGNLLVATGVAGATTLLDWDPRGRLEAIVEPGGTVTSFGYDAYGVRQSVTGPGGTVNLLLDRMSPTGFEQVLRETDAAGGTVATHLYGAQRIATGAGAGARYHHADALGSTRMLTDSTGALTDTYRYSGFGDTLGGTGITANSFLFAGEQRDASGLYYLRARYYDPEVGRFISRDPAPGALERPFSFHEYLYADANPVNRRDPSGRSTLGEQQIVQQIQGTLAKMRVPRLIKAANRGSQAFMTSVRYTSALFTALALIEGVMAPPAARAYYGTYYPAGLAVLGVTWLEMVARRTEHHIVDQVTALAHGGDAHGEAYVPVSSKSTTNLDTMLSTTTPWPTDPAHIYFVFPNYFTLLPLPTWRIFFGRPSMIGVYLHEYVHVAAIAPDGPRQKCSVMAAAGLAGNVPGANVLLTPLLALNPEAHRCFMETANLATVPAAYLVP